MNNQSDSSQLCVQKINVDLCIVKGICVYFKYIHA